MPPFTSYETSIVCADQYEISATIYTPHSTAEQPIKGAVLIGPATGIKQQFYANFASYLCENNYGVITSHKHAVDSIKHAHHGKPKLAGNTPKPIDTPPTSSA